LLIKGEKDNTRGLQKKLREEPGSAEPKKKKKGENFPPLGGEHCASAVKEKKKCVGESRTKRVKKRLRLWDGRPGIIIEKKGKETLVKGEITFKKGT